MWCYFNPLLKPPSPYFGMMSSKGLHKIMASLPRPSLLSQTHTYSLSLWHTRTHPYSTKKKRRKHPFIFSFTFIFSPFLSMFISLKSITLPLTPYFSPPLPPPLQPCLAFFIRISFLGRSKKLDWCQRISPNLESLNVWRNFSISKKWIKIGRAQNKGPFN